MDSKGIQRAGSEVKKLITNIWPKVKVNNHVEEVYEFAKKSIS